MDQSRVAFNLPSIGATEQQYLSEALASGHFSGDGPFTRKCHDWIEAQSGAAKALLTHSCTAAMEMAALLLDIQPGDEVIMPAFTFSSTANAFALRGGIPVFVDIREDTLNLDERLIEQAITARTRAIVPVHYAGVACEMDVILAIASKHKLVVMEDAAQGILALYKNRPLGAIGELGAYSFHETKNVISGEGGALLINDKTMIQRAEIIREKGTDRSRFRRGEVDKYTWQDLGSSYLPSEIVAALLFAQLERARSIVQRRVELWERYDELLRPIAKKGVIRLPIVPPECTHNGHLYYVLFSSEEMRDAALTRFSAIGISAVTHNVPLHNSPAGLKFGRATGALDVTDLTSRTLLRLPMHARLTHEAQDRIVQVLSAIAG